MYCNANAKANATRMRIPRLFAGKPVDDADIYLGLVELLSCQSQVAKILCDRSLVLLMNSGPERNI